ncbi:AAA family ATPase [Nitratifractor sp.]|uniref:AAA family ATPase n=1 Tax=Nitratifractor sp. TaxID=2268144 RepID=UPI0025DAB74C|nr:AAA family ATPase [Nitratifractor sp.]
MALIDHAAEVFGREPASVAPEKEEEKREPLLVPMTEIMQDLTPPRWLIKGIIPESGLVEIFGPSGSYKSFIILDMAYCIATGRDWQGMETRQGKVAYFAGEGFAGLRWRGIALEKHYGAPPSDLFVSTRPLDLMDERSVEEAGDYLRGLGGVRMAVIDTLHRNAGASDENSAKDFGEILRLLDRHIKPNADTVAWAHHTGVEEMKRSRGTSARYAALDASFSVTSLGKLRVRMECTKMKDAAEPDPIGFEMEVIDTGICEEEPSYLPITSLVPVKSDDIHTRAKEKPLTHRQEEGLRALRLAIQKNGRALSDEILEREGFVGGRGCGLEEWRSEAYKTIDAETPGAKRTAFSRLKDDLRKRYIVGFFNDTCYVTLDCKKRRSVTNAQCNC